MKKILYSLLLLLIPILSWCQLGVYSPTVTYTTTNPTPTTGDVVQYCVTVSNFTECNFCWFDALEIELWGCNLTSYDSRPNANWKIPSQITDEPCGFFRV